MTTTPTETTSANPLNIKPGRPTKAGLLFGIDLRGLFEDTEDSQSGLEGFGFLPSATETVQLKGRSPSTLTYEQPSTPSRTLTGPQSPMAVGVTQPSAAKEEPKPEPMPVPKALKELSAADIFSNYSKYDQGEQGLFGGQDVDYLRKEGVGDETIREVARLSSANQQTPAAVYAKLGGTLTSKAPSAMGGLNAQQYATGFAGSSRDVGEKGIFGGQDVDAMRQQGYSDEEIRATATALRGQGQALPQAVFSRLGQF